MTVTLRVMPPLRVDDAVVEIPCGHFKRNVLHSSTLRLFVCSFVFLVRWICFNGWVVYYRGAITIWISRRGMGR